MSSHAVSLSVKLATEGNGTSMNRCVTFLAIMLAAGVAAGQAQTDTRRADTVVLDRQLAEARDAALGSPEAATKRAAVNAANAAYRDAVEGLVAVRVLDEQIAKLQAQIDALQAERQKALEAQRPALMEKAEACRAANVKLQTFLDGGEQGKDLRQRRDELIRGAAQSQLAQPGGSVAQPARPVGQP